MTYIQIESKMTEEERGNAEEVICQAVGHDACLYTRQQTVAKHARSDFAVSP